MTEPYYQDATVTVLHGDCLDVLRELPDSSVDSVCTDPPYNLSDSGKRDSDCLSRILANVAFPDTNDRDVQRSERGHLPIPSGSVAPLNREQRTVRVDAGVGVPEGSIDLQGAPVLQNEISNPDVSAHSSSDSDLPTEPDAERGQNVGNFVLQTADGGDTTFCDGTCGCFTEPGPGLISVTVRSVRSASDPDLGVMLGGKRRGYADVGLGDDAASQPQGPASVVAGAGTVDAFVLRLDLGRRTGELSAAHGARVLHGTATLRHAQFVGAPAGAGGLSSVLQPYRLSLVGDAADRTITLHLPNLHTLKSTSAGGFMGKAWDGWSSPASFQRWCQEWATECLRVLKPGGHLVAFGGSRTWHRLTCAIEDAGFQVRESIAWMYGSGFPKSLDVSKAIDRAAGAEREVIGVHHRHGGGSPDSGSMSGPLGTDSQLPLTAPATDAAQQWAGFGTALKPAFEPICVARKPLAGTVAANVLAYGTGALNIDGCRIDGGNRPLVVSDRRSGNEVYGDGLQGSKAVDGGTSLGRWPANVVLDESQADALDQMSGETRDGVTVTRNLESGGKIGEIGPNGLRRVTGPDFTYGGGGGASRFFYVAREDEPCPILSSNPNTTVSEPCISTPEPGSPGHQAALPTTGAGAKAEPEAAASGATSANATAPKLTTDSDRLPIDSLDSRFTYTAKAGSDERITHNGIAHSTVKPLSLMRYLVRLVTPPGGLILEPFAGSGTTVEAAILEGFRCIAIEREADYLPLITQRIHRRRDPVAYLTEGGHDLGLFGDDDA